MSSYKSTTVQIQDFRNIENVNQNNMELLNNKSYQLLNSLYPQQPCLVGASNNNFKINSGFLLSSSTPTSATFNWNGIKLNLRFVDQAINTYPGCSGFSDNIQPIVAMATLSNLTITLTSPTDNYVVATLNITANDAYTATPSYTIASATESVPSSDNKLALFKLVAGVGGNLEAVVDANCAYNYITTETPDIVDDISTGTVYIQGAGGLIVNEGKFTAKYSSPLTYLHEFNSAEDTNGASTFVTTENSTGHYGQVYSYASNLANLAEAGIIASDGPGTTQNRLKVPFNERASLVYGNPAVAALPLAINDIVTAQFLPVKGQFSATDSNGVVWIIDAISYTGGFPSNNGVITSIRLLTTYNFSAGSYTSNIDLLDAGIIYLGNSVGYLVPPSAYAIFVDPSTATISSHAKAYLTTISQISYLNFEFAFNTAKAVGDVQFCNISFETAL